MIGLLSAIHKNENGMTIPELMVAMGILTITLAGAFSLMQLGEASWNMTTNKMDARNDSAHAMSTLSRSIRNAEDPDNDKGLFYAADKNDITFYTNMDADSDPEKVRYYLSGTNLMQTVTQPDNSGKPWTFGGSTETTAAAENLTNSAGDPLFAFYINGTTVSLPASSSDCNFINEVEINLKTLFENRGKSESTALKTRVFLRNLR